jgi:F0F1-type ATP synthase assembly protein I
MVENLHKKSPISQLEALGFVTDVFISVAVPTLVFAFLGRALDARLHTSPYCTVIGLLLSLAIAALLIGRKAKAMAERMKTPKV